jgi:hypothetical protein
MIAPLSEFVHYVAAQPSHIGQCLFDDSVSPGDVGASNVSGFTPTFSAVSVINDRPLDSSARRFQCQALT